MASRYQYTRRIAFAETDMAGIVHFANYYRIMEEAEHAFFRSVGRSIAEKQPDGTTIGWPRVSSACSYKVPIVFDDVIEILVIVERIGAKSITMRHEFYRGETLLAKGSMKIVCCRIQPDGTMASVFIPDEFQAVIEEDPDPQRPKRVL